jgi:LacI family transcriptional regulator
VVSMPTIYDVAKLAEVAPATVSRVINDSGYVSMETRRRVERAIADLNYAPNRLARGLRSKQTQTLGLIVTDVTNPFWTTVARGVEDVASENGFSVILCNTDESEVKQEQYVNLLLEKQVDGFLLVPATDAVGSLTLVQERKIPVVVLDRHVPLPVDTVRCDSVGGAYELVTHLLSLGHRRIALLGGSPAVSTAQDRLRGYRRALSDADIAVDENLILHQDYTQEAGYWMTQSFLRLPEPPTALFAVNNFIAIGAVRALQEVGLSIPDDMAVVGFDDLPMALVVEPFLTVAAQPAYEMGARATALLLSRIQGDGEDDGAAEPVEIVLPTELIIRRSSGKQIVA